MAIFRYPGSKRRLLFTLDGYLRPHFRGDAAFHSVFSGGGSDLLHVARHYPSVKLYANDLDGGIADVWRVVVGPEGALEDLEERILRTVPSVALRDEIRRQQPEDRVGRAFQAVFMNRTSYSGIMIAGPLGGRDQKDNKITDRWRPKMIVRGLRRARDLLLGRLEVASMDGAAYVTYMLEEDPDALFYCDPPYIKDGWQLYREVMTAGDHARLAAVLRQVPRFVVSYDDHPEVRKLYSWASISPVETVYTTANTNGAKTRPRRREVVITRDRPAPVAAMQRAARNCAQPGQAAGKVV